MLDLIREEHPDMTDQQYTEIYEGIMKMGEIAYQKTQEGKIFVTDDPDKTH